MRSHYTQLALCFLGCAATAASAQVAAPSPAVERAIATLRGDNPQVIVQTENGMVKRVGGAPLARGGSTLETADRFRVERAELFGAIAAELVPAPRVPSGPIEQAVMYERETGTYRFMLVRYQQERQGIPVFRSDLRVLVRNEGGFPVVLAASNLHDLGGFTVDPALAASPFDRLEQIAPEMTSYSAPEVVIWAGVNDAQVEPVLAVTFTADNYENPDATPERWVYVADAATGALLYRQSLIYFTPITGHVQGKATEGAKADICSPEVETLMPWARVYAGDVGTAYTDEGGDFSIPYAGSTPVRVQSYMEGIYFRIYNWVGAEETLSAFVTPGQPYTFTHNYDNDDELIRSQVNCYVAANEVRDWVLEQNADFPGIFQPGPDAYLRQS
jgi:hypothetical protein